jgi:autotransporter-associated beta strand protein
LFSSIAPIGVGKYGSGTMFLSAANTFTNTINLSGGTINFSALNNLSSAPLSFNGGMLQFAPGNSSDISARVVTIGPGGAVFDSGTNTVALAGGIGNSGSGLLTKTGSGSLILNGTNSYSGGTIVSNGTLAGTGVLTNAVTVLSGATVSPGAPLGNLTITGSLTNFGTLALALNKTGSALTNSAINGLSRVVFGGTLQLVLSGSSLTPGDTFKLFYSTNYIGAFTNLIPPIPGPGLAWNTNGLGTNGTLSVIANPSPLFSAAMLSGGNFVASGSGGYAGGGYSVIVSANLTNPAIAWALLKTGAFDNAGHFAITDLISPGTNQLFFRVRVP